MKKPVAFGKYLLLERINVGGMAEVFRAKAFGVEGFERLVAVKRILPNIAEDKEFIRMFIDEAKLAGQLSHANIAQIYELGSEEGAYYIALEHIHGRDIRAIYDRCRQQGEPMPVAQACFMVMKVCEGLDYAHNKRDSSGREIGLVHRDVSPQNIIISFEGEVKLIDFGIAKAAGKGQKTQAGILKGKFGYMSPEQVRGLPIDRRSDVFSTGIMLYELLTGERLFVGESDFSTLEKVRNVEILPPSTYNRKIPDELERIVLKALARDPEERYQNAIDLHDELQAFVYTAGEFYSRKDLAGWMKKLFTKEIEAESARLETFRQLKAVSDAPVPTPVPGVSTRATRSNSKAPPTVPARRSTQGMPVVAGPGGTRPPPIPGGRPPGQMAVMPSPGSSDHTVVDPLPSAPVPARAAQAGDDAVGNNLAWDDEELETQIYDNPEDDPRSRRPGRATSPAIALPLPLSSSQAQMAAAEAATTLPAMGAMRGSGPDLSNLSTSGRAWTSSQGLPRTRPATGSPVAPPPRLRDGGDAGDGEPTDAFSPTTGRVTDQITGQVAKGSNPGADQRDIAAPVHGHRGASPTEAGLASASAFGAALPARKQSNAPLLVGIVAVSVLVLGLGLYALTRRGNGETAAPAAGNGAVAGAASARGDQNTGFDLYVAPGSIARWHLDGELRTDRLPSRIRGVAPGLHTVTIEPPLGYMSQSQEIMVEAGKAPKVQIELTALEVTALFTSEPAGAKVTLIEGSNRTVLGATPTKATLDPKKQYQVLVELAGYVSQSRPITSGGEAEQPVAIVLEKVGGPVAVVPLVPPAEPPVTNPVAVVQPPKPVKHDPVTAGPVTRPDPAVVTTPEPRPPVTNPEPRPPVVAAPVGEGVLSLGAKPPCEIYIDGKPTGLSTPQREIKLPAGRHKVTLINNEFGIKETFAVEIKPDTPAKMVKDFSARLPTE